MYALTTVARTAYNFGFLDTETRLVEHYPYQDGLLISYWDESFGDNNVGDHPGGGLILPSRRTPDARALANGHASCGSASRRTTRPSGSSGPTRSRCTSNSVPTSIASKPAAPAFDDTKTWWSAPRTATPRLSHGRFQVGWSGVDVPKTGTTDPGQERERAGQFHVVEVLPIALAQ